METDERNKQVISYGPGYNARVTYDPCGCTLTLRLTKFEGLIKTIYPDGGMDIEQTGELLDLGNWRSHVDLPGEREDRLTDTVKSEVRDFEAAELQTWLTRRLQQHYGQSVVWTPEEVAALVERHVTMIMEDVVEAEAEALRPDPFVSPLSLLITGGRLPSFGGGFIIAGNYR